MNGAQFIRDGSWVWGRLVLRLLPLRTRTLPGVKYAGNHRVPDGRSSSGIAASGPGAHRCHLIIGGEFALVGFFYCPLDLSGQRFFVLDVVAKNAHRQPGRPVGQVFREV